MMTKPLLRQEMRRRMAASSATAVATASQAVCERLAALDEVLRAQVIILFAAMPREIDLMALAQKKAADGVELAYPRFVAASGVYELALVRCLETDFLDGEYNIPEPGPHCPLLAPDEVSSVLWLVPALAFDHDGHRLGRGKGYYDRLLNEWKGKKVGIGYDWQLIDSVPVSNHDVNMDIVVTDRRSVVCRAELDIMKGNE
jgi:5-formyltetrahydrofolate cyclo-ligase